MKVPETLWVVIEDGQVVGVHKSEEAADNYIASVARNATKYEYRKAPHYPVRNRLVLREPN